MDVHSANSFNEIYTSFYRMSFLFVKSYVHDKMAAEDIVSEALIKLWEIIKTEKIDPIPPYLFKLLKNSSLDYLKHQSSILPQKTKEIFILSRFGNKPHKEIAELFQISVKGVDYHIMQSVKELRSALKDYLPFLGAIVYLN